MSWTVHACFTITLQTTTSKRKASGASCKRPNKRCQIRAAWLNSLRWEGYLTFYSILLGVRTTPRVRTCDNDKLKRLHACVTLTVAAGPRWNANVVVAPNVVLLWVDRNRGNPARAQTFLRLFYLTIFKPQSTADGNATKRKTNSGFYMSGC